ncbi:hypothetical protein BD289DRAFT_450767 [Coniella lustricola]|uniref:Plus3 domain-containing protein n=1 Tax=Coniella lustricola TaxID=2025994 RepID=A0A2T3AH90_9PEZI|nr:hypothetical protein BD289DRAFT_450767 [Coniella lustricola]
MATEILTRHRRSEPGTPDSQQSVPMDESDSDDESTGSPAKVVEDDEENRYPVDGLFASHAEKKDIMNMREVEREQILADREAEKERLRQKALLRRLVTNNEDKQKKRKGGDADLDESARKKAKSSSKPGLDALKRARAEKSDRRNRRDNERRRDRSPSYRSSSSRSRHSDDSDVEWTTTKKRSKTPPEEAPLADLRDVERCRLSRTRFARVAFYPGFEEALTGCYVRLHIGPDPVTGQPIYRMAVIKGFKSGRPYAIENERGKSIVVDLYVIAAHGKAEREWPFIACSESRFTDSEWNRYQVVGKNEGVNIPRKPEFNRKADDINRLINHVWKEDEVAEKLKRQQALMDRFSGADRARIERELAQARAHGNNVRAEELQDKLDSMPQPRLAFSTSLKKDSPAKPAQPSQQDRLAEKNAINRQRNAKQVREAQLAERRRARETDDTANARGGDEGTDDLLQRSKVRSKGPRVNGAGQESLSAFGSGADAAYANGVQASKEDSETTHHNINSNAKGGAPMIHKVLTDDDVIESMDLELDVEID